ncbi:MAG: hypothetical protein ACOX75_00050 [Lachnospiraceae bacterium]|jgi:capsular polysaccharide biosynthesis protein
MEQRITFKNICTSCLKSAGLLLVMMILFGAAGVAFGAYSYRKAALVIDEKSKDYVGPEDVAAYEEKLSKLETDTVKQEKIVTTQENYKKASIYYNIDPYDAGDYMMMFYVDSGYVVKTDSNYQTPDRTNSIIAAYNKLFAYDGAMLDGIADILGEKVARKYILELINIESMGNNIVALSVVHSDVDMAGEIAHYLFNTMHEKINDTVCPHKTEMIIDAGIYEINDAVKKNRESVDAKIAAAEKKIQSNKENIQKLKENPPVLTEAKISREDMTKKAVLFGVIGIVLGLIVGGIIAVLRVSLSTKLQGADYVPLKYNLPLLGMFPSEKKRLFDQSIRRLENDPKMSFDEAGAIISANIAAIAGDRRLVLVSSGDQSVLEKLSAVIRPEVAVAGNVLNSASAIKTLLEADGAIIVEERFKADTENIDAELDRLVALGKEVVGIII